MPPWLCEAGESLERSCRRIIVSLGECLLSLPPMIRIQIRRRGCLEEGNLKARGKAGIGLRSAHTSSCFSLTPLSLSLSSWQNTPDSLLSELKVAFSKGSQFTAPPRGHLVTCRSYISFYSLKLMNRTSTELLQLQL